MVICYGSNRKLVHLYNLDIKTWQGHYEKEKYQANLIYEHKCYTKNISKLNPRIYKKRKAL